MANHLVKDYDKALEVIQVPTPTLLSEHTMSVSTVGTSNASLSHASLRDWSILLSAGDDGVFTTHCLYRVEI